MSRYQEMKTYVFAPVRGGEWSIAGMAELYGPSSGCFYYVRSWLSRDDGYPLDPINLPLTYQRINFASRTGIPGVLSDATSDAWGRRLMIKSRTRQPKNEIERLLTSRGSGVGGLRFSLSRTGFKAPLSLAPFSELSLLQGVSELVEQGQELPEYLAQLVEAGSSMGGARPKASCIDKHGDRWLVKFALKTDTYDVPAIEFACSKLAGMAGINMPDTQLLKVNDTTAFAVKRFDWQGFQSSHYISAYSLINQPVVRQAQSSGYSYSAIAEMTQRFCTDHQGDREQLFRRMTFNSLVGNGDDHSRNHGFLYNPKSQRWKLSPAFDIVPQRPWRNQQSINVGKLGVDSSMENVMSDFRRFGFDDPKQAVDIVSEVVMAIEGFAPDIESYGVPAGEANAFREELRRRCEDAKTSALRFRDGAES